MNRVAEEERLETGMSNQLVVGRWLMDQSCQRNHETGRTDQDNNSKRDGRRAGEEKDR